MDQRRCPRVIGTDHQTNRQVVHGLAGEEHAVVREHDAVGAYEDLDTVPQEAPTVDHDAARRFAECVAAEDDFTFGAGVVEIVGVRDPLAEVERCLVRLFDGRCWQQP